jgi:predicted nucleic-acid-binding protein
VIALDTNVLVRFLVADDAGQAARARAVVARADREGEPLFVSDLVLCELVWVLQGGYRFERSVIVETVRRLLASRALAFRDSSALVRALDAFAAGKGDFADHVILAHARAAGCSSVVTFDRQLLREQGFAPP